MTHLILSWTEQAMHNNKSFKLLDQTESYLWFHIQYLNLLLGFKLVYSNYIR